MSDNTEIEGIVARLSKAADIYYNEVNISDDALTDAEYDALEQYLRSIAPNHPYLSEVGSEIRGGKVQLPYPMGSLDQVYEGDSEKWVRANNWQNQILVLSDKMDGQSGALIYGKGGILTQAFSRGDGRFGADITRHVKRMPNVPKKMPMACAIRVEFELSNINFSRLMLTADRQYKNPRNYLSGRMNKEDAGADFYNLVDVFATSVFEPQLSKRASVKFCGDNGFRVPPTHEILGRDINDDFLTKYLANQKSISDHDIDGIVIDLDDLDLKQALDEQERSSLNPRWARKYKVGTEENRIVTTVVAVHWEASKDGYLKPRIEFNPVELEGATLTYCTGFHAKNILEKGIGPGAEIVIIRAGSVIPFCSAVIVSATPSLPSEEVFGPMLWTENEVDMYLVDPSTNRNVALNKMFAVFQGLDIPNLREGSIATLYDAGFKTVPSIIKATRQELTNLIGENGNKIYDGLKTKLNPIPLGILAGASEIFPRGVGRRKMTKLLAAVQKPLVDIAIEDIVGVEGFEFTTAEKIVNNVPAFEDFLKEIDGYFTLKQKEAPVSADLENLVVVFTGIRDADLQTAIEAKGGTIGSSVSSKTTHLICKDPNAASGKLTKARDLGVKLVGIEEARKLWG